MPEHPPILSPTLRALVQMAGAMISQHMPALQAIVPDQREIIRRRRLWLTDGIFTPNESEVSFFTRPKRRAKNRVSKHVYIHTPMRPIPVVMRGAPLTVTREEMIEFYCRPTLEGLQQFVDDEQRLIWAVGILFKGGMITPEHRDRILSERGLLSGPVNRIFRSRSAASARPIPLVRVTE